MARAMKDSGIEWIGEIPAGWGTNTAFQLFIQVKNKNEGLKEQNLLSLSYGKIKRKSIETVSGLLPESFDGYNIIEPDDIVLRLTDLQNDQKSLRVGLSPERGIVTSAYLTLRNRSTSLPKYLYYYLHAFDISKGFYGMGAGVRQGLNWDGLKWLKILTPPVQEQEKIVSLLDGECARIDAVIEQTRTSIEEYKKLKQSVITQAVTKGIRPGRKMKDSKIKWVKELPEEWAVIPSKYLFRNSDMRRLDSDEQMTASQQYGIITQAQYMELTGAKVVFANKGLEDWKHVEPYDFIISLRSFQGGLEMSETTGCITWHYIVLKPCKPIYSYYFKWLFKSELYIKALQRTCNFIRDGQDLRYSNFVQVPLFEPSLKEQQEIADYLNKKCAEIDTLITTKETFVAELESYKKSLIFEYVTGKKEVYN